MEKKPYYNTEDKADRETVKKIVDKLVSELADLMLQEIMETKCSQADFAATCGVSTRTIEKIVSRTKGNLSLITFIKIYKNLSGLKRRSFLDFFWKVLEGNKFG